MSSNPSKSDDVEGPTNLDHALLESLFYNEMVMMEESASMPNNLFDTFSTHPTDHYLNDMDTSYGNVVNPLEPQLSDPKVIAEKDLLRDFGVTHTPLNSKNWDTSLG
jgi:hypothetical protein